VVSAEEIAVMGFSKSCRICAGFSLRRELVARIERERVDAFIGIDAGLQ
jgi:lipid A disaccharide synthetase